jgi:hypothetical protein
LPEEREENHQISLTSSSQNHRKRTGVVTAERNIKRQVKGGEVIRNGATRVEVTRGRSSPVRRVRDDGGVVGVEEVGGNFGTL